MFLKASKRNGIEINGVTKARPETVTPRTFQQRLQWTAPLNQINQRITAFISTSSLVRYLPDQKGNISVVLAETRGSDCCASRYPELKILPW